MEIDEIAESLDALKFARVGSTVTCDPPPSNTDIDYLILVKRRDASAVASLGFDLDQGGEHYEPSEGNFNSWRSGNVNLIVTDSEWFYNGFILATNVAKALNLMCKRDRVTLFQAILYRNFSEE
jgi:hypothetical protein